MHTSCLQSAPQQSNATDIPNTPTPTNPAVAASPKRQLEELVYEILEETMDEDYSTTINDPMFYDTDNLTGGVEWQ